MDIILKQQKSKHSKRSSQSKQKDIFNEFYALNSNKNIENSSLKPKIKIVGVKSKFDIENAVDLKFGIDLDQQDLLSSKGFLTGSIKSKRTQKYRSKSNMI
jgi:hypothetical protein